MRASAFSVFRTLLVCALTHYNIFTPFDATYDMHFIHQGADKSLARPSSLSIIFSVQGTGGSPTGPDAENKVGDQDIGSPGGPVSSGLQVPGELFPSWSG
jgi:hypothetical protein